MRKRTARVKPLLSVKRAVIPITLIGMLLLTYLGHQSWCLLSRPVVDLDALRSVRKDRDKPPSFMRGFMTMGSLCVLTLLVTAVLVRRLFTLAQRLKASVHAAQQQLQKLDKQAVEIAKAVERYIAAFTEGGVISNLSNEALT